MAFGTMITIFFVRGVSNQLEWLQLEFHPLPTALIAMPVGILRHGIIALLLLDRKRVTNTDDSAPIPVTYLIVSIGFMFVIGGITRFIIGPNDRNFNDGVRFILSARAFKEITGLSEGIAIKSSQAITVVSAFIVVSTVFGF